MSQKFNITAEERDFLQSLGTRQSRNDENLYGFVPAGWLPNWVKQGYNQSIEGMAQQVMGGEPVFSLDQDYDPNMLEDIASTVVSFLTPTDFATMVLGGGAGGLAVKSSMKMATKKLIQSGAKKAVAERAVSIGSKRVINQARAKAVTGATGLGFYSGLQSALGQQVTEEDISFTKTLKDAVTGAALGAGTGALGVTAKSAALQRGFTPAQSTLIEKGAETALFGTAGPVLEGELPTVESYIHAAGVIGGLSLSRAVKDRMFTPKMREVTGEELESVYRESAKARAERMSTKKIQQEVWTNEKNDVSIMTDWVNTQRNEPMLSIRKVNKDGTLGESSTIAKKDFFKSIDKGGYRLKKTKDGVDVDVSIQRNTFRLANALGMVKDGQLKMMVDMEIGKDAPTKPSQRRKGEVSTNYELLKNNYEARQRILRQVEKRAAVEQEIKRFNKAGIPIYEASGSSLFKKALPGAVYDVLVGLKPLGGRVKDPRYQPIFSDVKKDYFTMDARQGTLFQQLIYELKDAEYVSRDGKVVKGLHKLNKIQRQELAEDLRSSDAAAKKRVAKYRTVLDSSFEIAKKSGLDVAEYIENYFPRQIDRKILKIIRDDIEKFGSYDSRVMSWELNKKTGLNDKLNDLMTSKELSAQTIDAIEKIRAKMSKTLNRNVSNSEAFERLRNEVFSEIVFVNKNIEIARTQDVLPEILFEQDAGIVLTNYMAQLAKRVAFVETAGKDGSKVYDKIKSLKDLGGQNEAELLYKAINSFTGTIELDRKYNWSPKAKGVLNDLVNFQVATKIGLGFATIPNLTQPFISSVLKAGYAPFFRGTYKMVTDKEYRNAIKQYAGSGSLELHQMVAGFNPSEISFTAKVADKITKLSGFQGINRINKLVSAYTGYEAALKWQKIAQTTKTKARKDWAKSNLEAMGVKDINKKITQKDMARAMYEFSRDTQLQKNVFREPAFFNDPRMQPFVLFKRFGYRQAEWIATELRKEVVQNKNAAFALRLGVAGMAGGAFVQWAKRGLSDFLSGKDVYDENYKINVEGEEYGIDDFIDAMASVGGFGIVSDIIASESKWRAFEFAAKPVMIQDANKAYITLQKIVEDMETFGPDWVVGQRALRNVSPVFGSVGRRLLSRFETEGQRKNYVRYRFGSTRSRILDYMIDGNDRMAKRLIREWNNSFPERPIMYDDVDASAINDRLMNKYKKEINP